MKTRDREKLPLFLGYNDTSTGVPLTSIKNGQLGHLGGSVG